MLLDLTRRITHWVRTHRLGEPAERPHRPNTMPTILMIWPDRQTFFEACAAVKTDRDMLDLVVVNGRPTAAPANPFLQDVPCEEFMIEGLPIVFATLDGKRLVPLRPTFKTHKHAPGP